jgi:hypothetical protein
MGLELYLKFVVSLEIIVVFASQRFILKRCVLDEWKIHHNTAQGSSFLFSTHHNGYIAMALVSLKCFHSYSRVMEPKH